MKYQMKILLVVDGNVEYYAVPHDKIIDAYPELTNALTKAYQRRGVVPKSGAELKVKHDSNETITIQRKGSNQTHILLYV